MDAGSRFLENYGPREGTNYSQWRVPLKGVLYAEQLDVVVLSVFPLLAAICVRTVLELSCLAVRHRIWKDSVWLLMLHLNDSLNGRHSDSSFREFLSPRLFILPFATRYFLKNPNTVGQKTVVALLILVLCFI